MTPQGTMAREFSIGEAFANDPFGWLHKQALTLDLPWLLIHTEEGPLWGRCDKETGLSTSDHAFPAFQLKGIEKTLIELRLFGQNGEMLVWRTEADFTARLLMDGPSGGDNTLEELCLLWGVPEQSRSGYTLMSEGERGLRHAIPLVVPKNGRAGLRVRHYLHEDEEGQLFIAGSRLVDLETL